MTDGRIIFDSEKGRSLSNISYSNEWSVSSLLSDSSSNTSFLKLSPRRPETRTPQQSRTDGDLVLSPCGVESFVSTPIQQDISLLEKEEWGGSDFAGYFEDEESLRDSDMKSTELDNERENGSSVVKTIGTFRVPTITTTSTPSYIPRPERTLKTVESLSGRDDDDDRHYVSRSKRKGKSGKKSSRKSVERSDGESQKKSRNSALLPSRSLTLSPASTSTQTHHFLATLMNSPSKSKTAPASSIQSEIDDSTLWNRSVSSLKNAIENDRKMGEKIERARQMQLKEAEDRRLAQEAETKRKAEDVFAQKEKRKQLEQAKRASEMRSKELEASSKVSLSQIALHQLKEANEVAKPFFTNAEESEIFANSKESKVKFNAMSATFNANKKAGLKSLQMAITQISATASQVHSKIEVLSSILSGLDLNTEDYDRLILSRFLYTKMAMKLVAQGDAQIHLHPSSAWPVGSVTVALALRFDMMRILVLGFLYKSCPFLVPRYPDLDMFGSSSLDSMGRRTNPENNTPESIESHFDRMSGFAALFSALCVIPISSARFAALASQESKKSHPFGCDLGWSWLSTTLNCPPLAISSLLLASFLEIGGGRMLEVYGKQFQKLVKFALEIYLPKCPAESSSSNSRLKIILEKLLSSNPPVPDGYERYLV